jgi:tetratricopeptide (TPR) repeat protein
VKRLTAQPLVRCCTNQNILIRTGNLREAECILRVNISEADKLKEMNILADNLLNLGLVRKTSGDLKEAENLMEKSLSVYSNLQQKQKKRNGMSEVTAKLTDLYLHLGDIDKAMKYAELGLASVGDFDDYLLRINILQSTASVQWVQSDFDGCYESTREILRLARQENNLSAMVAPTGKLGNCCWRKGKIGDAEQHYKEQLELALKVGYRQKVGSALNNLGNIYHIQGNYSESMNCYSQRLDIAHEMGDQRAIATAVGNIGVLLFSQEKLEEAGTYFEKMLKICREIEYRKGESIATGNLTAIFLDLQELDKAMEYAKKKLDISEQIGDKQGVAQAYGLMGYVFRELENYDQAGKYFLLKLNRSTDLEDKKGCAFANRDLGDLASIRHDPVEAASFLDTAIRLLRELGARNLIADFLLLRAEIAYDLKKYVEASIFIDEALGLSENIGQQEIQFNLNLLKASILAYTSDISIGVAALEEMLSVENTEEHMAALYCRIYRITGEEQKRRKALDLYTVLNIEKSSREIREKIRFLSSDM